ncbi:MAG: Lin1244/Lin1753 domain-containing protein [Sediminibacterium sp.]
MKSNTYYFSHDYNAANDTKILFLRHQLGMEGYGIYWYLIEQLANAGGKLPLELVPVLAMQMHCTDVKVNGVLMNFGLFTIESGEFWSERLAQHLDLRLKLSESGKTGAVNRWANRGAIGGGNAKESKVKEIKRKENKVNKRKVNSETLFVDSEVNTIEKFEQSFIGTQYEIANFNYYFEVIKNWSDSKGEKKKDWIATAKNWMARDITSGKFIDKNYNPNAKRINQNQQLSYAEREAARRNSL